MNENADATVEATNADESQGAPPSAKKPRKKLAVVAGVLAVIVVAAGAGFWVWHEQPSFCNAICHTPMDPYLPTYEADPGQTATDKWGNEVSNASAMMAASHRAVADSTCLDCHVPTLSEQVSEGIAWVSGSYEVQENATFGVVLPEKSLEDLVAARGIDDDEFCLNASCHNMTREDLEAITADKPLNPHEARHDKYACSDCHKGHRASVVMCASCHGEVEIPDGWLTPAEAAQLA